MARRTQGRDVPADEVDGVAATQLLPWERRVLTGGQELVAEHGDGALAVLVDVRERPALRPGRLTRMHRHAACLELLARAAAEVVVGERGEEEAGAGEIRELDRRDGSAARRLRPRLERVHDLPRSGRVLDPGELDPLDVSYDRDLHDLTS